MKRLIVAALLTGGTMSAYASNDLNMIYTLGQTDFRLLSEDLSSALSYKALAPAEPLGVTGFDIGIEATGTKLEHASTYDKASSGTGFTTLPDTKLHVHKGLPFGIDVGAFYSYVPNSNIKVTGAELRYAFIEGGVATPALALRGTYTKLSGVDQLDFNTRGLELTTSKGFAMFTPYAGIGKVWTTSTPNGIAGLTGEKFSQNKYFVGANLNFGLTNVALEGDKTGDATSYGAKIGFRW